MQHETGQQNCRSQDSTSINDRAPVCVENVDSKLNFKVDELPLTAGKLKLQKKLIPRLAPTSRGR